MKAIFSSQNQGKNNLICQIWSRKQFFVDGSSLEFWTAVKENIDFS